MNGNKSLYRSFACAANGLRWVVSSQRNIKIHLAAATAVFLAAAFFRITFLELALVTFAVAMVLVTELVNSAVEKTVDLVTCDFHPLAGLAKDAAAGAVLLAVFFSAIIGVMVFFPYLKGWLAELF